MAVEQPAAAAPRKRHGAEKPFTIQDIPYTGRARGKRNTGFTEAVGTPDQSEGIARRGLHVLVAATLASRKARPSAASRAVITNVIGQQPRSKSF
jgi:hypothetical protein